MSDLLKLLDGNADDVKAGLAGKSHDDLLKLRDAEQDGKTRKGVLEALDAAIAAADADRSGGFVQDVANASGLPAVAADLDASGPTHIAPAGTVDTAGAPQQIVPDVDLSHPAVDGDPRAGTTERQNRIDFNDPRRPGHEVVEDQLKAQG